ncbi:hypothetical protein [Lysinibacillus odysseyi]|uniref:hypothetical protein n=1 Tax=Lysinibacillus odysseyi TaxID=202611 RepID=UPI0005693DDB|nr:hypothetical protein [Lysinibacillus odysseyi]
MKKYLLIGLVCVVSIILSACGSLYKDEEQERVQQTPDPDLLNSVQRAVDAYQQDTGVLPIKNSEEDTDLFVKYQIDFSRLTNGGYLVKSPENSFEQGGIFQYVIWNAEETPTVKLVDLRMTERLREVNIRFMATKYPQFKDRVADYVYTINFDNIGYKTDIAVDSPYSNNLLPLVVSSEGDVYVDYSIDLQRMIEDKKLKPVPGEDIRFLLADEYPVIPAYSLPYTVNENNEVVFMYDPVTEREQRKEQLRQEQQELEQNKQENSEK